MPLNGWQGRQVVIKGNQIGSVEQFYDAMERLLGLPAHFGRNLDALWDVLTTDIAGPVEIVWEDYALSRAKIGERAEVLMELLQEVAAERPDIRVSIR